MPHSKHASLWPWVPGEVWGSGWWCGEVWRGVVWGSGWWRGVLCCVVVCCVVVWYKKVWCVVVRCKLAIAMV